VAAGIIDAAFVDANVAASAKRRVPAKALMLCLMFSCCCGCQILVLVALALRKVGFEENVEEGEVCGGGLYNDGAALENSIDFT